MRPFWPAAALVAVASLLAAPGPASAAAVSVVDLTSPGGSPYQVVMYRAAPGETNQLRVLATRPSGGLDPDRRVVSDAGAAVVAGPGCTSLDAHTAECLPHSSGFPYVTLSTDARLGDRDDTAEAVADGSYVTGAKFDLWGEDGNDRLLIPAHPYLYGDLRGGPGNDVLHGFGYASVQTLDGGPGADEISGGRSPDVIRDGDPDDAPAPDRIDGGPGRLLDVLSYEGSARSLRVDLETGRGGAIGEGDRLAGLEEVRGGDGDDVLRGSPRGESLIGGGGGDFISGRAGADNIEVGSGGHAFGGRGADHLHVRGVATIVCGADDDLVEELGRPTAGPFLARDCEGLHQGDKNYDTPTGITVDPRAGLRTGRLVRLPVRCGDCTRGRVRVTRPDRPFHILAQRPFRLTPPHGEVFEAVGSASVTLPARVVEAIRRRPTQLRLLLLAGSDHAVWTVRLGRSRAASAWLRMGLPYASFGA